MRTHSRCGKFQTNGLLLLNLPLKQLFVSFYGGLLINLLLIVFLTWSISSDNCWLSSSIAVVSSRTFLSKGVLAR